MCYKPSVYLVKLNLFQLLFLTTLIHRNSLNIVKRLVWDSLHSFSIDGNTDWRNFLNLFMCYKPSVYLVNLNLFQLLFLTTLIHRNSLNIVKRLVWDSLHSFSIDGNTDWRNFLNLLNLLNSNYLNSYLKTPNSLLLTNKILSSKLSPYKHLTRLV